MVDKIKAAFAKRVSRRSTGWRPSTKQEALKKVESIVVGVGYPTRWRDYSGAADQRRQRLRQPEELPAWPNIGTRSPRSASRWTARNGGCRRSW